MKELGKKELMKVEGGLGLLETIIAGAIIATISALINEWDDVEKGFNGEPMDKKN
jgi:lactobin A/cerein 7B family class IIb bacteriocin